MVPAINLMLWWAFSLLRVAAQFEVSGMKPGRHSVAVQQNEINVPAP
jgi:hypothetical protein